MEVLALLFQSVFLFDGFTTELFVDLMFSRDLKQVLLLLVLWAKRVLGVFYDLFIAAFTSSFVNSSDEERLLKTS